jgi:preprotein translocase subunit SecA
MMASPKSKLITWSFASLLLGVGILVAGVFGKPLWKPAYVSLFGGKTIDEAIAPRVQQYLSDCDRHHPDLRPLLEWTSATFHLETSDLENLPADNIADEITQRVQSSYTTQLEGVPQEILAIEERRALLYAIDTGWQEHLAEMEELREGVFLRSQGQKDPLVEYKIEAFTLFGTLMDQIKQNATTNLFHLAAMMKGVRERG